VYKKAMDAFNAGDFATAKSAGRECVEYAAPLGDWWGTAMGLEAQAMALQAQGALDDALHFYGEARLLNHDLLLLGDEYGDLRSIIDLCFSQERWARGREAVERALELGLKIGDQASQADLYEKRASFEEKLGDKAAAEKSRAQAQSIKK
jgi:tetratricopeptide (TPR) repeat protein